MLRRAELIRVSRSAQKLVQIQTMINETKINKGNLNQLAINKEILQELEKQERILLDQLQSGN